ncbi:MAG: alpha-ribazole phosphatase family protein [Bacteroidota bacterium]
MEICLIRHTTPAIEKGICYGQADLDLADTYPVELEKVRKQVHGEFDLIVSSPLKRCRILAEDLFSGQNIQYEDRIKEYDFGEWEMVPWNEMDKDLQEKWMANFVEIPAPGGESLMDMKNRIQEFVDELMVKDYKRIVFVTHSGVIRIISAIIEQTDLARCFDYQLSYGVVKTLTMSH